MKIKEMKNLIEERNKEILKLDLADRLKFQELKKEYLQATGYLEEYNGRYYLPLKAKKDQVNTYFTAHSIAYDIIINR